MRVASGLDRVAAGELARRLRGQRVGLVAHPASVDASLRHARQILEGSGAKLVALFGPEHGYGGGAQDMVGVGEEEHGGLRVYSLYGDSEEALKPPPGSLDGLDLLVVDLQDVGARYYTYVWTAALALECAAAAGVPTLILDRPNPLGGEVMEGAPQRPGYRSFVGLYDVPVRHGLTIAEVCSLVAAERRLPPEALEIVTMRGYERAMGFDETGLPWVLPSPNMPTFDTALVYPGGCLLEGTTLSEGRGTTRPFELWGAPWVDGEVIAASVSIEGAVLRPLVFTPTTRKHAGFACGGVQVHVVDGSVFRSYEAYLRLIAAALVARPEQPAWRTEEYEFVTDRPAIDLLTGGPEYREAVDAARAGGALELEPLLARERAGARAFAEARAPHLLYR